MTLFQLGDFVLNSGARSSFKLECDALTDEDWAGLAKMVHIMVGEFQDVLGVPRGGLPLARHLRQYCGKNGPTLLVDDVLTTGGSMERLRPEISAPVLGAVVFARGPCPRWIRPLLQLPPPLWVKPCSHPAMIDAVHFCPDCKQLCEYDATNGWQVVTYLGGPVSI